MDGILKNKTKKKKQQQQAFQTLECNVSPFIAASGTFEGKKKRKEKKKAEAPRPEKLKKKN